MPGVTITLVNTNNGATQVLLSGSEGDYRAVNLQPGPYLDHCRAHRLRGDQAHDRPAGRRQRHHQPHPRRRHVVRERHRQRREPAGRGGQGTAAVGDRRRAARGAARARPQLPGAGPAPARRGAPHRGEQPVRGDQVRRARRPAQRLHDDPRWRRHRRLDVGQPGHQHDPGCRPGVQGLPQPVRRPVRRGAERRRQRGHQVGRQQPERHRLLLRTRQGPQRPQRQGRHRAALQPVAHRRHLRRSHRAQPHAHVRRLRVPDHRQGGDRLVAGQQSVCDTAERQLPVQPAPSTSSTPVSTTGSTTPSRRSSATPTTTSSRRAAGPTTPPARSSTTASRTASSASTTGCWARTWSTRCASTTSTTTCSPSRPTTTCRSPAPRTRSGRTASRRSTSPEDRQLLRDLLPQHGRTTTSSSAASSRAPPATSKRTSPSTARSRSPPTRRSTPPIRGPGRSRFVQQTPGFYNYSSNQIAAFVQDDWRVTDRLRLNLGLRYDLDTSLRQNDFYEEPAGQSALRRHRELRQRRSRQRHQQPAAAARRDLRHPRRRPAGGAGGYRAVRHPQPAVAPADVDGPDAGLRRPHHRPATAAALSRHQCRAGRPHAGGVHAGRRRRSLYLIGDDYVLPYSFNTTAGIRLADQRRDLARRRLRAQRGKHQLGTTDRNLPPSGAVNAANPRPVPSFSQVGMLHNFSNSWYDAFEVQLRTRVRGSDSLQVSYAYSKSTLDGVDLLQHVPGHRAHPARGGRSTRPTRPITCSVAALDRPAVGIPAEWRVPRDQRRTAGRDRRHRPGWRSQHAERSPGRPAASPWAAATSTSSWRSSTRYRATRNQAPVDPELLEPDPIITFDVRLTKAFSLGAAGGSRPSSKPTTPPTTRPSPAVEQHEPVDLPRPHRGQGRQAASVGRTVLVLSAGARRAEFPIAIASAGDPGRCPRGPQQSAACSSRSPRSSCGRWPSCRRRTASRQCSASTWWC